MKLDVIHKTTFRNYPAQKIHILVIYETITIYLSILSSIFLSNLSIHLYIYLSIYHISESMFTDPLAKGQLSTHAPASGPSSVLTYLYTENVEK